MMGGMKLNLLFVAIGMALLLTAAEAWAQTATDLKCKGCVSKGDLSKGAVATKSLKSRAVKASKIANNAVTGDKIADGAVAGEKIADGAVAMSKLSNDVILPLQVVDATGLFLGFILGANDVLIHADDTTFVLAVGKNSLSSNVQAWFEDTACTANPFIRNDQESNSAQLAPQAAVAGPVVTSRRAQPRSLTRNHSWSPMVPVPWIRSAP